MQIQVFLVRSGRTLTYEEGELSSEDISNLIEEGNVVTTIIKVSYREVPIKFLLKHPNVKELQIYRKDYPSRSIYFARTSSNFFCYVRFRNCA